MFNRFRHAPPQQQQQPSSSSLSPSSTNHQNDINEIINNTIVSTISSSPKPNHQQRSAPIPVHHPPQHVTTASNQQQQQQQPQPQQRNVSRSVGSAQDHNSHTRNNHQRSQTGSSSSSSGSSFSSSSGQHHQNKNHNNSGSRSTGSYKFGLSSLSHMINNVRSSSTSHDDSSNSNLTNTNNTNNNNNHGSRSFSHTLKTTSTPSQNRNRNDRTNNTNGHHHHHHHIHQQQQPHQPEYYLKVLVVGGPCTGKSTLIKRYCTMMMNQQQQQHHHRSSSPTGHHYRNKRMKKYNDRQYWIQSCLHKRKYRPTLGINLDSIELHQTKTIQERFKMKIRVQLIDVPHSILKNNHQHPNNGTVNNTHNNLSSPSPLSSIFNSDEIHGVMIVFDISNPKSLLAVDQWRNLIRHDTMCQNVLLVAHKSDLPSKSHALKASGLDAYVQSCQNYIGWHMTSVLAEYTVQDAFHFLFDRILRQMYRKYGGLPQVSLTTTTTTTTTRTTNAAISKMTNDATMMTKNHHHQQQQQQPQQQSQYRSEKTRNGLPITARKGEGRKKQKNGTSNSSSISTNNGHVMSVVGSGSMSTSPHMMNRGVPSSSSISLSSSPSSSSSAHGSDDHHLKMLSSSVLSASSSSLMSSLSYGIVHESLSDEFFNQLYHQQRQRQQLRRSPHETYDDDDDDDGGDESQDLLLLSNMSDLNDEDDGGVSDGVYPIRIREMVEYTTKGTTENGSEIESDGGAGAGADDVEDGADAGNNNYHRLSQELTSLANFHVEVKSFFNQIIDRLEHCCTNCPVLASTTNTTATTTTTDDDGGGGGSSHSNRHSAGVTETKAMIQIATQLAREEQLNTLDKIMLLFQEMIKHHSVSNLGTTTPKALFTAMNLNVSTRRLNIMKRAIVELRREFYTTMVHHWSLLWYSIRTQLTIGAGVVVATTVVGSESPPPSSADPLMIRLIRRREHLRRRRALLDETAAAAVVITSDHQKLFADNDWRGAVEQQIKQQATIEEPLTFQSISTPLYH